MVRIALGLAHEELQQGGHIHMLGFQGQGIGRERVLLHRVNIRGRPLGDGENQRDANDADGTGKGGQQGAALFGKEVF